MVAVGLIARRFRSESVALLSWWTGEIADLWRKLFALLAPNRAQTLVILVEAQRLRMWVSAQGGRSEVCTVEPDSSGAWPEEPFDDDAAQLRTLRTVLLFTQDDALVHLLRLPAAVERNLPQVVALAMERELPLPLAQLAVDWRLSLRDPVWLHVQLLAIQKSRLESAQALIGRWGFHADRVAIAPQGVNEPDPRHALGSLSSDRRRSLSPPWTPWQRRLARVAAAMVAIATLVTAGQWIFERAHLAAPVREARSAYDALSALRRDYSVRAEPLLRLADRSRSADAVDILAGLSQSIDKDSWAHEIAIQETDDGGYKIDLSVRAPRGRALAEQLDQLPNIQKVDLVSAGMAEIGSGKELVRMSMLWKEES